MLLPYLFGHDEPQVMAAIVGIVGTAAIGMAALLGRGVFRLVARRAAAVEAWAERMSQSAATVETIAPHFSPNGGKSIVDRVSAIQHEVELNRIQLAGQRSDLLEVCQGLEAHRGEVSVAFRDVTRDIGEIHRRIDQLMARTYGAGTD